MNYTTTLLLFSLLLCLHCLASPIALSAGASGVHSQAERRKAAPLRHRRVRIMSRFNPNTDAPNDQPRVYFHYWNAELTREVESTSYDLFINSTLSNKKGDKDSLLEIGRFRFTAGSQNVACTVELDLKVKWTDDDAQNQALFTIQPGPAYLWPCGFSKIVGDQAWVRIVCPVGPAICDGTGWQGAGAVPAEFSPPAPWDGVSREPTGSPWWY